MNDGSSPPSFSAGDDIGLLIAQADAAARAGELRRAEQLLGEVTTLAPTEGESWKKLAACRRALGLPVEALAATNAALSIAPRDPVTLLLKGALLDTLGGDAEEAYRAALSFLPSSADLPPQLRAQADRASAQLRAAAARRAARLADAVSSLALSLDLSVGERQRVEAFASVIAEDATVMVLPGLARPDYFEAALFQPLADVARDHAIYLNEYLVRMSRGGVAAPYVDHPADAPLDQWKRLNRSHDWSAVHLLSGGNPVAADADTCPRTMASWQRLPLPVIEGRSPNLMFSILAPGTHIPRHQGVFNARLVVHVPLLIPDECVMTVGTSRRHWVPGEALVFDDTIPHEAYNGSDATRVVLIGDVWHPDLSANERAALRLLMAAKRPAAVHGL